MLCSTHSRWSDPARWAALLAEVPPNPDTIVRVVSGLLLHPFWAPMRSVTIPEYALADKEVRTVEGILDLLVSRDGGALVLPRVPSKRVFCVCSGYARLATSIFRAHAVPARCRVGFASYFTPGFFEDHWACEYWDGKQWHVLDAELDEAAVTSNGIAFAPFDVPRDQFVDAATAWCRMRNGDLDPAKMGISAMGLAGTWFAAGNVMLDVAALNEEGVLPWEKWSVGRDLVPGRDVPGQWLHEFDKITSLLRGAPDEEMAHRVYRENDWVRVTPTVLSFLSGTPTEVAVLPTSAASYPRHPKEPSQD